MRPVGLLWMVAAVAAVAFACAPEPYTGAKHAPKECADCAYDVGAFTATPGVRRVDLGWVNPEVGDFAGVTIRRATGQYPQHPADGLLVCDVGVPGCTDTGLAENTSYYYAAFAYNSQSVYSPGVVASAAPFYPWSTKAPMPTGRSNAASSEVNGVIYVIGGYNGSALNTVEAYDPATDSWSVKAPMLSPRQAATSSVVNGVIYVIGGDSGSGYSNTVEAYDPATDSWSTKAPMPTARSYLTSSMVNGIIYAIGGSGGGNAVEAYDPATDSWSTKTPMPTARSYPTSGVVNGIIYAIGGANGVVRLSTVEAYDPATDSWSTKTPMPTGRSSLTSGVVNDVIYTIGGFTADAVSVVEAYDPVTDSWSTKTPMPIGRRELTSSEVNGVIYAIGGIGGPDAVEAYDPALDP